ncbi:hypothetical protein ANCCEY_12625 [Ancylostoma ceylanicum]|uniref:NADP-dependent oxidoreductase domain-containing protein n=1 Tax=Ancylostoma ceylanicum TaxID=53326 RepID=A0A0D6LKX2_9BILA|nr:hypothetical protein ANCCEY_12625 [Ancylostoma ceylanicum]
MSCAFQAVKGGAAKLNTGFYIPLVGLGTYKITGDQVKQAVDAALSCGYRMFDTAKYYVNEPELGAALEVHTNSGQLLKLLGFFRNV